MLLGERFLTQPDLFPARLAGTPAGNEAVELELPGGPYDVAGLSSRQRDALEGRYGPLCKSSGARSLAQAVPIRVFMVDSGEFLAGDTAGRVNDFDFDYLEDRVRLAGHRVMAQLRLAPSSTLALWTSVTDEGPFLELFENCFRVCVAYRLLESGGALVHSAAIADNGKAWLFFGHSGVGKTTLARSAREQGFELLSDDLNAVVARGDGLALVRMPFSGELRHPPAPATEVPLTAAAALVQAESVDWKPLTSGRAMAALASSCPFLNRDPHRLPSLLDTLRAMADRVPIGELSMTLNPNLRQVLPRPDEVTA